MIGVRKILGFFHSLVLALLVVSGGGGIMLNVHTCLSHHGQYIHLFQSTGHCDHPGSCFADNEHLCCHKEEFSPVGRSQALALNPVCCLDELLLFSVDVFVYEKQHTAVGGHIVYSPANKLNDTAGIPNVQFWQKPVFLYNCFTAPPVKDRPAKLCVFLI